jgi:GNAT superfamily N-acetyltransferase
MVGRVRFGPQYREACRLADGTHVRLRLLRPEDRAKLLAGFDRLSAESRYRRFFTAMPDLPKSVVDRLLHTDGVNHLAIGAEADDDPPETAEGYGVARFLRLEEAPDVAEAAVAVVDHMQRRGLGKLLLSRLAAAARERGITRFRAEVLRTNTAIIELVRELDETATPTLEGPLAVYELAIPESQEEASTRGLLFGFLRLAATGPQVLLRRLLGEPPGGRP